MSDLISRNAVLDRYYAEWGKQDICDGAEDRDWLKKCVDEAPSIEATPVAHGHPVYHNRPARYEHYEMARQTENGEPLYKRQYYTLQDNPVAYCSECGKRMCSRFTSFCPNCGMPMTDRAIEILKKRMDGADNE